MIRSKKCTKVNFLLFLSFYYVQEEQILLFYYCLIIVKTRRLFSDAEMPIVQTSKSGTFSSFLKVLEITFYYVQEEQILLFYYC